MPFRGMLLTPQGGPRCLAPTARQIPVYLMVFSTFLCRAFTAHYLYPPRWSPHSSITLHGAPGGRCTLRATHHGIPEPSALVLGACFPLKPPFRSMLLTLRGGPESLAPRAHRIPVYPMVFPHSYTVLSRRTVRTWYSSMPVSPLPRWKLASMQLPPLMTRASSSRDGSLSSASDTLVGVR
jgi:hypothetical protein